MDNLTHRVSSTTTAWAACGVSTQTFVDNPTCLWCVTNTWVGDTSEIVRVLTLNSVKDIEEAEGKKTMQDALEGHHHLVVAGLVHVSCVEVNPNGVDRYYAACMYTGFLRLGEPKPVVSYEVTDAPVNCLVCALRDFLTFEPHELDLLRSNRRRLCAQTMHARGVPLPAAMSAMANWEAEEHVDYGDVD